MTAALLEPLERHACSRLAVSSPTVLFLWRAGAILKAAGWTGGSSGVAVDHAGACSCYDLFDPGFFPVTCNFRGFVIQL
jgi:hypothetical protein